MGRPVHLTIEPTNICNLRCPVCETGAGILGRSPGTMTLGQFRTIIDRTAPFTNSLLFYFMGEPLLNRDAYAMIRYAKDRGIPFISTCTNGETVDAARLVESGIDEVSFQIGGMTQETHQIYRINGRLDRVLGNLDEIITTRRRRGAALRVVCGFILMKHNEDEVGEFRRVMERMGVDEAIVVDPCVRTWQEGQRLLPTDRRHWFYDPAVFGRGELRPRFIPPNECPWIYYSLTVLVNGDVVPCCRDARGHWVMGNLLESSLDAIWNGEKFREFRRRLHAHQASIEICRLCSSYPPVALK